MPGITLADTSTNERGQKVFSGNKNLKGSQAYPPNFGRAVKNVILKNERKILARRKDYAARKRIEWFLRSMSKDAWDDAELGSVIQCLTTA